jgi:hypothetical protein
MATFLTEWMEPEAEELMIASIGKNLADKVPRKPHTSHLLITIY